MKMFKLRKLIVGTLVAASVLALNPVGASAEWKQDSIGWKWYKDDGNYTIGWQQIEGNWYYFYYGGYMAQDTFVGSEKYYVDVNGVWGTCTDHARWLKAHTVTLTEKVVTDEQAADINRKLSSGLTLGQAEKKIEDVINKMARSSDTYENMTKELSEQIKKYGTTENELKYIIPVSNSSWKQNSVGWWYEEGNSYAIGWRWIDGQWYHFDSNGYMEHDKAIGEEFSGGTHASYILGSGGHIVGSTAGDGSLARAFRGESNQSDTSASSQAASTSTSSSYAKNIKTDTSKVLSSGMTLKQAKLKIDSLIAGMKAIGETVDNNMDYINKLCKSMGTTYDEIKSFQG